MRTGREEANTIYNGLMLDFAEVTKISPSDRIILGDLIKEYAKAYVIAESHNPLCVSSFDKEALQNYHALDDKAKGIRRDIFSLKTTFITKYYLCGDDIHRFCEKLFTISLEEESKK